VFVGELEVKDNDVPAKMRVKFPLNVLPGEVTFKVFITDYDNFAGIFTCQKLPVGAHRQSATILSRTRDLDRAYIEKIRSRLTSYGVNVYDLSIINQANCPRIEENPKINVDIDPGSNSQMISIITIINF
jgi:apolipoprotein D and lipocalin family protein